MKTEIRRIKKKDSQTYKVTYDGLTKGELLAMKHALEEYAEKSRVGVDVCAYFTNALFEAKKTESSLTDI